MISITKLNKKELIINCDLIESIEANPDTTITMTNGHVFIVLETVDEVLENVIEFKNQIFSFRIDRGEN